MQAEIEKLIIAYAWAFDEQDFDGVAALFVEDATFELSTPGVPPAVGLAAIVSLLAQARGARAARGEHPRHLVNNVRVIEASDDAAHVVSYMTLMVTDADGVTAVALGGTYDDRLVAVEGRWMFASRRITFDRDR